MQNLVSCWKTQGKFLKNNLLFISGTIIGSFLGYLYHFIVSRHVSVEQYGEIQNLLAIFAIFSVFNTALSYFAIKHIAVFADHGDYLSSREFVKFLMPKVAKLALLFLLAIIAVSPAFKSIFRYSDILGITAIGLAVSFSTLGVIYQEVLRGFSAFFTLSAIGVASAATKLLSGAGLAIAFGNSSAVLFSLFLSALAVWFLAKIYSQKKIGLKSRDGGGSDWRKKYFSDASLKRTTFKIFIFSLGLVLIANWDIVLVKFFSSSQLAGYYGAYSLLGKIVFWLSTAIIGVMLPGACAQGYLEERPGKELSISYFLIFSLSLVLIGAYYFIPEFIINLFFGGKFIFEVGDLWLFGLMSLFLSLLTLEASLSFARQDFRIIYFLVATVIIMTMGVSQFHSGLKEIVTTLTAAFFIGYLFALWFNLKYKNGRKTIAYDKI